MPPHTPEEEHELAVRFEEHHPIYTTAKPFINGGLSGMLSCCCVHPLDTLKVRQQLGDRAGGSLGVARRLVASEGAGALYNGLSAGLLRQARRGAKTVTPQKDAFAPPWRICAPPLQQIQRGASPQCFGPSTQRRWRLRLPGPAASHVAACRRRADGQNPSPSGHVHHRSPWHLPQHD